MDTRAKLIIGGLTLILAYDAKVALTNQRRFDYMKKQLKRADNVNKYLSSRLEEANVPATEFDAIVLKNLI